MIKNHQSILSNGGALNQRQGHHTLVILAMNDFLDQRFVLFSKFQYIYFISKTITMNLLLLF